ncbi:MAG: hypothetical protein KC656_07475, partial [Myxococcales bacterium]|nr:hypothetical protein [Myxococcales bacterium]
MSDAEGARQALERRGHAAWRAIPEPLRTRVVPALVAGSTGIVLGLSAWLTPNPTGHATHLQLGLSPCTILTLTGYPCPV